MAVQPGFAFDSASSGDQISWPAGDGGIAPPADAGTAFDPNDSDWPGTDGGVSPCVTGGVVPPLGIPTVPVYTYRMRAFDTTLAGIVYWNSDIIDINATDYSGPGPLTNIVVSNILPV